MSSISEALASLPPQFVVIETQVSGPPSPKTVQLCGANPLRWALLISPPYTTPSGTHATGYAGINPQQGSTNVGMPISDNSGPLIVNFRQLGILAQQAWYGFCDTADAVVTFDVIEVIIQQ